MNIEKLDHLRQSGVLSEEEFQKQKKKLFETNDTNSAPRTSNTGNQKFGLGYRGLNVLLHLSQYCSLVIPFLGIVVPILLWSTYKENDPIVDQYGKNIINWSISSAIYLLVSFMPLFFIGSYLQIFIVAALYFIFPVIGAIKVAADEVWEYPLTIKFIR